MSRLAASFVLGYHGCNAVVAEAVLRGETGLVASDNDFDWLGPGAYFWEADPLRALERAQWRSRRERWAAYSVVGAVIDLRNCLDLAAREDLEHVRRAHASFIRMQQQAGLEPPRNRDAPGDPNADLLLRYLDCAVIRHLYEMIEAVPDQDEAAEPFDTVRGVFTEGGELYPGSGFQARTHVQIAVRNPDCILGFFRPRPYPIPEAPPDTPPA